MVQAVTVRHELEDHQDRDAGVRARPHLMEASGSRRRRPGRRSRGRSDRPECRSTPKMKPAPIVTQRVVTVRRRSRDSMRGAASSLEASAAARRPNPSGGLRRATAGSSRRRCRADLHGGYALSRHPEAYPEGARAECRSRTRTARSVARTLTRRVHGRAHGWHRLRQVDRGGHAGGAGRGGGRRRRDRPGGGRARDPGARRAGGGVRPRDPPRRRVARPGGPRGARVRERRGTQAAGGDHVPGHR